MTTERYVAEGCPGLAPSGYVVTALQVIKTGELSPGAIDLYPLLRNYDVGGGGGVYR